MSGNIDRESSITTEDCQSDLPHMDFSLETPEERVKKVEEIIAATPSEKLSNNYLEKLSDYIIFAMDKQEKKEKKILTDNRMVTVNKRETSFEGLASKFESGEDGIYNLIANDKNIIFQPKVSITPQDLEEIPQLKKLHDEILKVEDAARHATGKKLYLLKKQIIQMRQDQYVIKGSYKKYIYCNNTIKNMNKMQLDENIWIDAETGKLYSDGLVNMYDYKMVSAILCNYSRLKEDAWDALNSDLKWFMEDFDKVVDNALRERHPYLLTIVIAKIDGKSNEEIREIIKDEHGINHTPEYISDLWRNKIPKLIAEEATSEYLEWYYTFVEKGKWKKCSRCGQIKLAHQNFFSRNNSSKSGYYSICKRCRSVKKE